jgi:RHS repeat-associated protein
VNGYYTASTGTWTYTYDGDGVRTAKAGPPTKWGLTGQTQYATSRTGLAMVIGETRPWSLGSGADYVWYLYGPDRMPLAQLTEIQGVTSVVYLHHDQQGSTRLVTNSAGSPVYSVTYDPYGKPVATTGANPGIRHGYNGEYTDPETGFQYLRARFYDPGTGQFLSRDPANAMTRSAYGYVGGNPLNATDPSGLFGIPFTDRCIDILDDSCNSNADGESFAESPRMTWRASRALINGPTNAVAYAVGEFKDRDHSCGFSTDHWVAICADGGDRNHDGNVNAQTFGSVIFTDADGCDDFLRSNGGQTVVHETKHSDQYAIFGGGIGFPLFFALGDLPQASFREWRDTGPERPTEYMISEAWAGFREGQYACG